VLLLKVKKDKVVERKNNMSKYNLTNLLKEYVGGSKIGVLNISAKELVNKMEDVESKGIDVDRYDGLSADGKTYLEFHVHPEGRDEPDASFSVYDYKFGLDPSDEDNFMTEYPFSVGGKGGTALRNAQELVGQELVGIKEELPSSSMLKINNSVKDAPTAAKAMIDFYNQMAEKEHMNFLNNAKFKIAFDKLKDLAGDESKTLEKFTEAKDWIQKAIKRPGALHRALDIPRDKDIPHSLINKDIKKMDDLEDEEGHLDKRDLRFLRQLDLAKTLEKFNENKEPGKLSGIEDVINTLGEDDLEKIVAYMKERGRLTETVDEDIWVMAEKAITHLGTDQFAEALVRAMSTDDAKLYITGILKDWDIPMADEDYAKYLNESLEESVVKNMVTLLSDYGSESEINTYMDSVGREFMINPKSVEDYNDFNDDDWVEDFREWINDKYEDVREHFNRFIK